MTDDYSHKMLPANPDAMLFPLEVVERVHWYTNKPIPLTHMHYYSKAELSKGEAWQRVPKFAPGNPPKPWHESNPWRKCHTENYWVWFRIEADDSYGAGP